MKILISNRSFCLLLIPALLLGWITVFHIQSAHSQTDIETSKAPLHIVSDKMIAQRDQSMVEFIGNVRATQEDSIVLADSIKVFFNNTSKDKNSGDKDPGDKDPEDKDAKSNVKKIISTGNVEYTAGERKAFADKAVYTTENETLVLTGESPKLVTGSSFVTGKKITLFRNQDKVLVESDGKKRVEALFNPEDSPNDKP